MHGSALAVLQDISCHCYNVCMVMHVTIGAIFVTYLLHAPAFLSKATSNVSLELGARTKAITAQRGHDRDVWGKGEKQVQHTKQHLNSIRAIHMSKVLLTVLHNNLRDTQSACCACACCNEASVAD